LNLKEESSRRTFLIGFAGIVLVYSLYYLLVRDSQQFYHIPRKIRHVYKFLSVIYVYGIGMWALKKYSGAVWMIAVWHFVHLVLILFLLLIGFVDWFYIPLSFKWKHLGASAHEFLISPVLYCIAGIVHRSFFSECSNKL